MYRATLVWGCVHTCTPEEGAGRMHSVLGIDLALVHQGRTTCPLQGWCVDCWLLIEIYTLDPGTEGRTEGRKERLVRACRWRTVKSFHPWIGQTSVPHHQHVVIVFRCTIDNETYPPCTLLCSSRLQCISVCDILQAAALATLVPHEREIT